MLPKASAAEEAYDARGMPEGCPITTRDRVTSKENGCESKKRSSPVSPPADLGYIPSKKKRDYPWENLVVA